MQDDLWKADTRVLLSEDMAFQWVDSLKTNTIQRDWRAYSVSVTLLLVKPVLFVLRLAGCVNMEKFTPCVLVMKCTQDATACCLDSTHSISHTAHFMMEWNVSFVCDMVHIWVALCAECVHGPWGVLRRRCVMCLRRVLCVLMGVCKLCCGLHLSRFCLYSVREKLFSP